MDTGLLKKFAREARQKLLTDIGNRIQYCLHTDSAELRSKSKQITELETKIRNSSLEEVTEEVAYTWFNRFIALRFMDVNGYTELKVVSPVEGHTLPEILEEAKKGYISDELKIDKNIINDLLDGRINSDNPQEDVYRLLLVSVCNHWHTSMPFMFEKISDYTELLLPEGLLGESSILSEIRNAMTEGNCSDVEIIGWLYQFYIADKKDVLISAKKKYKTEDIPAVTQLFTPQWIVRYMVQNTLGRYWCEAKPACKLKENWEFYLESRDSETRGKIKELANADLSPEDIKVFDPAMGSGHILSYAYDLLYDIYQSEGYEENKIPVLILEKNIYGLELDNRATQLAKFCLFMKARKNYRRIFKKNIKLNILEIKDINDFSDEEKDILAGGRIGNNWNKLNTFLDQFKDAKTLGSIIKVNEYDEDFVSDCFRRINEERLDGSTLADSIEVKFQHIVNQAKFLTIKYEICVANPPYMGGKYMETILQKYVNDEYKDVKSDLFSVFIKILLDKACSSGHIGMVTPFVWMFIKSYEELRKSIVKNSSITSLIQLEYNAFEPACVPVTTFTIRNTSNNFTGEYIKLSDFTGSQNQPLKTLEAVKNPEVDYRYTTKTTDFSKIPGSPIAYWVSDKVRDIFDKNKKIGDLVDAKQGLASGDNDRFLRLWFEVSKGNIGLGFKNTNEALKSKMKWFPINKGGSFRKWFGNNEYLIAFDNENYETLLTMGNHLPSRDRYFKESISWSDVTSANNSFRYYPKGFIFDATGHSAFVRNCTKEQLLSLCNNKFTNNMAKILNPTMHFHIGYFNNLPAAMVEDDLVYDMVSICLNLSKDDWDTYENSWNFTKSPLLELAEKKVVTKCTNRYCPTSTQILKDVYIQLRINWKNAIKEMQKLEEKNNKIFIETYKLQDELTSEVPLKEVTLTCNPHYRYRGKKTEEELEKLLLTDTMKEFISYSVGCMMGRYSLAKPGLILANQGETISDYVRIVSSGQGVGGSKDNEERNSSLNPNPYPLTPSFMPDDDNIIPILDDTYFSDDITGRFKEFLKVTFGEEKYEENLKFIENAIGKDIRKYFVKDFYTNHVKMYKKRPIYWMFSSPNNYFNVLIYMHRYNSNTISQILNDYLREFREKLLANRENLQSISASESNSASQKNQATKKLLLIEKKIKDVEDYEKMLLPLASERIEIDLDDGVKVNYNKFGKAIKKVVGLSN